MALRPAAVTWRRQPRGQCRCAILLVERPAYSPASLAGPGLSFCTMGVDESDHSTQLSARVATVARERLGPQLLKETPSLFYLHCEPAAGRRRSTRPCDRAACLRRPEERPIPAQPLGRWSPLTRRSRTTPPTASISVSGLVQLVDEVAGGNLSRVHGPGMPSRGFGPGDVEDAVGHALRG